MYGKQTGARGRGRGERRQRAGSATSSDFGRRGGVAAGSREAEDNCGSISVSWNYGHDLAIMLLKYAAVRPREEGGRRGRGH